MQNNVHSELYLSFGYTSHGLFQLQIFMQVMAFIQSYSYINRELILKPKL